jgi:predicted Zn-dependent protease
LRNEIMPARKPRFAPCCRAIRILRRPLATWPSSMRPLGAPTTPSEFTAMFLRRNQLIRWPFLVSRASRSLRGNGRKRLTCSTAPAQPYDPTPGLELVALYELLRDWNSAKAVAAELYAQFPRDVNVVVAFGRTRLESGDTNAAISSYKLAHELAPDATPIRSAYVALLKQAQYFLEARDVLKEAMIREPQNASLKADLIRADAEIDGVDAATSKAREFAASDPGNSIYDVVSAELYEKAGRGEEAVSLLENAAALRPPDKGLPPALARLYVHIDLPAKAEAFLKARLKADPQDSAARSELAFYYVAQKNDAAAISEYARLVEDRPADPSALNNLACLYQRQGELKKARELAERAFKIPPRDAHIVDTLGWILVAQGEADAALTYLNAANLGHLKTWISNTTSRWRFIASAARPMLVSYSKTCWAPSVRSRRGPRRKS